MTDWLHVVTVSAKSKQKKTTRHRGLISVQIIKKNNQANKNFHLNELQTLKIDFLFHLRVIWREDEGEGETTSLFSHRLRQ